MFFSSQLFHLKMFEFYSSVCAQQSYKITIFAKDKLLKAGFEHFFVELIHWYVSSYCSAGQQTCFGGAALSKQTLFWPNYA